MNNIVEIKGAGIKYNIFSGDKKNKSWKEFWALRDINISIKKGEALALIGLNGSGKTTFLKTIAGILAPDEGVVDVKGKICGLLDVGSGFSSELSGYENIFLSAALLGMSRQEIDEKFQEIVDFADIGDFLYVPVKCYSQGMFVRLAFSIAVFCEPDILIVDDTFAVGDETFKTKAVSKLYEFKQKGVTMVFATHDMGIVSDFGTKAVLLNKGTIEQQGDVREVLNLYMHLNGTKEGLGVLRYDDFKLIFNNGSIFLYYKEKEVTCGLGGYFRCKTNGVKYDSSSFIWCKKEDSHSNVMCFLGRSPVSDAEVEIIFEASKEGFLVSAVGCNDKDVCEVKFHFMLPCEYDRWQLKDQNGQLPKIKEVNHSPLKIIQENCVKASFSLIPKDISSLPDVLFKTTSDNYSYLVALNSGFRNFCRIVEVSNQLHTLTNSFFIGFNCKDKRPETAVQNKIIIGKDLRIALEAGQISFFDKEDTVFASGSLYTSIYTDDNVYNSLTPVVEVVEFDDNEIVLRIEHHRINAYEIWTLAVDESLGFVFRSKLYLQEDIKINNYTAVFFVSDDYTHWASGEDKGAFPDIFLKGHWSDFLQRNLTGKNLKLSSAKEKSLVFAAPNTFFRVYNWEKDFAGKHRIVECFSFDDNSKTNKEISLSIKPQNEEFCVEPKNTISQGNLKVVFADNKLHIYKEGVLVSKQLGMYTSYYADETWNTSSFAVWKIEEITPVKMVLVNKFEVIDVSEKWIINISNGKILLEVVTEFLHSGICSFFQFNLMTSSGYDGFLDEKGKGQMFPEFKADTGPKWDKVFTADGNKVTLTGKDMPPVSLGVGEKDSVDVLAVLNTDIYYRARVMQYFREIKEAKTYKVFEGVII